ITEVICLYGGDIIKFLGDAVVICFRPLCDSNMDVKANVVERACVCSLHIMLQYPSVEIDLSNQAFAANDFECMSGTKRLLTKGTCKLTLHVAVTAGEVDHVIVRVPGQRMDYFINGPCLNLFGEMMDHAKSGELAIDATAWAFLRRVDLYPRSNANDVIFAADQLEQLLNVMAAVTFENMQGPTDAELASTLEKRVTGLRLGPMVSEDCSETADDNLIERFSNESIIYKLNKENAVDASRDMLIQKREKVDDKGHILLSLFGLPPFAHVDDAVNALHAGVVFANRMESAGLGPVYVSVATGEVMFTVSGAPIRMDASFRGDVVNLSARILGLHHLARAGPSPLRRADAVGVQKSKARRLGRARGQGQVLPTPVYAADKQLFPDEGELGRKTSGTVVGYLEERDALRNAFQTWSLHTVGSIFVVEGASGMGKSTLLDQMKQAAVNAEISYCVSKGSEIEQKSPYACFGVIVAHIFYQTASVHYAEGVRDAAPSTTSGSLRSMTLLNLRHARKHDADPVAFVMAYGVEPDLTPLLKMILPWLIIEETERTKLLDGMSKRQLLVPLIASDVSDFNNLLIISVNGAITNQFDRLDPHFQQFLRKSSILGQDFSLTDLGALFVTNMTAKELRAWIEARDIYHFLAWPEVANDADNDDLEFNPKCSFRHISIMNVIYESQSYADRFELHEKAAEHYETFFSFQEHVLPVISYHYSKSKNLAKTIFYGETLGKFYLDNFIAADCVQTFNGLIDLADRCEMDPQLPSETRKMMCPDKKGLWHTTLAWMLIDVPWPEGKGEMKALKKAVASQVVLFVKSRGAWIALHIMDRPIDAVQHFSEMYDLLTIWQAYSVTMTESVLIGMFNVWFIIERCPGFKSGKGAVSDEADGLSPAQQGKFCTTISEIVVFLRSIGVKHKMGLARLGYRLFDAAGRFLKGSRPAALRRLKSLLTRGEFARPLKENMRLVGAFVQALVGIYTGKQTEMDEMSQDFFDSAGAVFFGKWVRRWRQL
ncbi:hypothetical protein HK101_001156, partial [Irineochytrium annulatum]